MALPRIAGKSDDDSVKSKGPGGGLKALVIMLIVMDLAAGGAYAYLTLVKGKEVEKSRASAQRKLFKVRENGVQISQAVVELSRASTEDVSDPQTPALSAAMELKIDEYVKVRQGPKKRFARSDVFEEHLVTITWIQKNGYKFKDLIDFHKRIEAKNPKVQIQRINFGKRDDTEESWWRPISSTVRVFKPKLEQ